MPRKGSRDARLTLQLENARESLEELRRQELVAEQELARLNSTIDTYKDDGTKAARTNQLTTVTTAVEEKKKEIREILTELRKLKAEISDLQIASKHKSSHVQHLRNELQQIQTESSTPSASTDSLGALPSNELDPLEMEKRALECDLVAEQRRVSELKQHIERLSGERETLLGGSGKVRGGSSGGGGGMRRLLKRVGAGKGGQGAEVAKLREENLALQGLVAKLSDMIADDAEQ